MGAAPQMNERMILEYATLSSLVCTVHIQVVGGIGECQGLR
jgi:hypothetical protein